MTSTAWTRVHQQYDVAQRVLKLAGTEGDPNVLGLFEREIDAAFGGLDGFLLHLERRWYLCLEALLDTLLDEQGHGTVEPASLAAEIALRRPMMQEILSAYADHPALGDAPRRHPSLYWLARQITAA
jgi:hypothetical protein